MPTLTATSPTAISSRQSLFVLSCVALITTAMTFGIRAGILSKLGTDFGLSGAELGLVAGTAFWGFTLSQMIGGALVDQLGMRLLLIVACLGHIAGVATTIMASGFYSLFFSTLLVGLSNGLVEAVCNPLVAGLYPTEKTKMLNRFHVWFPGGIVISGLISYALTEAGLDWKVQMATILVPAVVYGLMLMGKSFPQTERVQQNIPTSQMWAAVFTPLFLLMAFCMLLTAATELGTNQYIDALLKEVGVPAILLLVWINGIMALGRAFAGGLVHRLAPAGMLLFSAVFATLGLLWLSQAQGYTAYAAAAVFAVGICYFWPTMLGFVNEYIPASGALGLSIMGGVGMLSVAIVLPIIGGYYDQQVLEAFPKTSDVISGKSSLWVGSIKAAQIAGSATLKMVAILPAALILIFAALYFRFRKPQPQHGLGDQGFAQA